MSEDPGSPADLVPSAKKELAARTAALVRRGLDDVASLVAPRERIEELCDALWSSDCDRVAQAAKTIIDMQLRLDPRDDGLCSMVFALVSKVSYLFPYMEAPRVDKYHRGEAYYPPSEELERLLMGALESLVGAVEEPSDAMLHLLLRGKRTTKIEAAERLAGVVWDIGGPIDAIIARLARAAEVVTEVLGTTEDEFLALVLRNALVYVGHEDADDLCRALAQYMAQCPEEDESDWCGNHLFDLAWECDLSTETLVESLRLLEGSELERSRQWATGLVGEIFAGGADHSDDAERGTRRLKDCPEHVLTSLIEIIWREFLRENHLQDEHALFHAAGAALAWALKELVQSKRVRWPVDKDGPALGPESSSRYDSICWTLRDLLTHREARQQVVLSRERLRSRPDDVVERRKLAEALESVGLLDDATCEYRELLDRARRQGTSWWSMGQMHSDLGAALKARGSERCERDSTTTASSTTRPISGNCARPFLRTPMPGRHTTRLSPR